MPRGAKQTDEQKLEAIDREIETMQERKDRIQDTLNSLNSQRKEILQNIHQKKLDELSKLLDQTGRSPEDLIAMINDQQSA